MSSVSTPRRNLLLALSTLGGGFLLKPLAAAQSCSATSADTQGPFYTPGAPHRVMLAPAGEPGDRLVVRGTVTADDCRTPLAGALLDVWQADAQGAYHYEKDNYRLRGQILTDKAGAFEFTTVMPGRYQLDGGYRPAHIHLTISHPKCQPVTTQLYFQGDPYLAPKDACGLDECKSDDPGRIVELRKLGDGRGFAATFPVVLKRAGEHAG